MELDLSTTFAESAASFSAGHLDKAKQSALTAETEYRAVERFLPRLGAIPSQKRELIAVKLGKLTPLIEMLSAIK